MLKLRDKEGKVTQMYAEIQKLPDKKQEEVTYKQINIHVGGLSEDATELDALNKAIIDYNNDKVINSMLISNGTNTFEQLYKELQKQNEEILRLRQLVNNYEQTR